MFLLTEDGAYAAGSFSFCDTYEFTKMPLENIIYVQNKDFPMCITYEKIYIYNWYYGENGIEKIELDINSDVKFAYIDNDKLVIETDEGIYVCFNPHGNDYFKISLDKLDLPFVNIKSMYCNYNVTIFVTDVGTFYSTNKNLSGKFKEIPICATEVQGYKNFIILLTDDGAYFAYNLQDFKKIKSKYKIKQVLCDSILWILTENGCVYSTYQLCEHLVKLNIKHEIYEIYKSHIHIIYRTSDGIYFCSRLHHLFIDGDNKPCTPTKLELPEVSDVIIQDNNIIFVTVDGLYGYGSNINGELGLNHNNPVTELVKLTFDKPVITNTLEKINEKNQFKRTKSARK